MTATEPRTPGVPALLGIVNNDRASRVDRLAALNMLIDGYSTDNPYMSDAERKRTVSDLNFLARVNGLK